MATEAPKWSGLEWTVTLRDHQEALRRADAALQSERDRRYAEVNVEREKALKIKETADETARILAREIQTYKDEKANELREQINRERNLYATKDDLQQLGERLFARTIAVLTIVVAIAAIAIGVALR